MSSMFFLTLVIVLVSGLIAYIGDLIGRKMGRKRLSLLGLRPRYTAIVISVGIGMLIAALTLTATFLVNKRVREAFFTPIERLHSELTRLSSDLLASQNLTANARMQLAARTGELRDTELKRQQITAQLSTAQGSLTNEQDKFVQKQQELASVNRHLADVKQRLTVAQQKYLGIRNKMNATSKSLAVASNNLSVASNSLSDLYNSALKQQENIERLKAEKASLEAAIGEFALTNFSPLTFEQGQEILTGLFSTSASKDDLRTSLAQFLKVAEHVVRQRSPQMPAANTALLFYRTPSNQDGQLVALSTEEAINLLAERIKKTITTERVLLQLAPANNVRVDGPAMIVVDALTIMPNVKIYDAGDEVAHVQIADASSRTSAVILGKIADDLLRDQVPTALRAKKMPMIIRRFDPGAPAHISSTPSMISWDHLLAATEKARKESGSVLVSARASHMLRCFDPLDLTLSVAPAKP